MSRAINRTAAMAGAVIRSVRYSMACVGVVVGVLFFLISAVTAVNNRPIIGEFLQCACYLYS